MRLIASARLRVAELAPYGTGERLRAGLANPAHGHAQVLGLDDDHHAAGSSSRQSDSAIWVAVAFNWGRLAKTLTSRASFDNSVIRPSLPGM